MWISYLHPKLDRPVHLMMSADGVFFVRGADVAYLMDYSEAYFCRTYGRQKIGDLVYKHMEGLDRELLDTVVFDFKEIEEIMCWKKVEILKSFFRSDVNVLLENEWGPSLRRAVTAEYVGIEPGTMRMNNFVNLFKSLTLDFYDKLSVLELDASYGHFEVPPKYIRVEFAEQVFHKYELMTYSPMD